MGLEEAAGAVPFVHGRVAALGPLARDGLVGAGAQDQDVGVGALGADLDDVPLPEGDDAAVLVDEVADVEVPQRRDDPVGDRLRRSSRRPADLENAQPRP
nr:hypothetical protein [Glycomyces sp. TRM65418]QZD57978.1 hypothetical protein K3N28_15675 [Glycomyces sp. TRM65418]